MWRTPTKWGANIPPGVGADSSCPYPNIIKYVYSHYWIRVSVSTHTHFHIINYVFLHHQIHISISPNTHFLSPFRGYIHIRGHDKSAPTAANGLRKCCWRSAKMQRTHREKPTYTNEIHTKHSAKYQQTFREMRNEHSTKLVANTPPGVGADSSCPYPNIIKYVYSRHQIRVSVSTHTHIHITEYVFLHY